MARLPNLENYNVSDMFFSVPIIHKIPNIKTCQQIKISTNYGKEPGPLIIKTPCLFLLGLSKKNPDFEKGQLMVNTASMSVGERGAR